MLPKRLPLAARRQWQWQDDLAAHPGHLRSPESGASSVGLTLPGMRPVCRMPLTPAEHLAFAAQWQGSPASSEAQQQALQRWCGKAWARRPARSSLSQGSGGVPPWRCWLCRSRWARCGCWTNPFDALDDEGVSLLCAQMQAHADAGGAVLFTCHSQALAERVRRVRIWCSDELGPCAASCCWACAGPWMPCCRWASLWWRPALFPAGVGPEPERLREMAPGVIWVCALLASLLSLHGLF